MAAKAGERARKTGDFRCYSCHHQVRVTEGERFPDCHNCGNDSYDSRSDERGNAASSLADLRIGTSGWHYPSWWASFFPAGLKKKDALDLNMARTEIDLAALRLSMREGDDGWEAGVVAAAYRQEKADRLLQSGAVESLDAWEPLNTSFHRSLVAACPSRWLLRVREMLGEQVERYRRASVYRERAERNFLEEHKQIADAVLARDEERACRLVVEHYARTADGLLPLLRSRA